MRKSNQVQKPKGPGRERAVVNPDDFVREPTAAMLLLAELKNEGHSWQTLADEISERLKGDEISHALARRVTLGYCESKKVEYALGLREQPAPVPVEPCADCGEVHTRLKQCEGERQTRTRHRVALEVDTPAEAAALRSLLARHGSRRRIARALVEGELRIVEGE